MELDPDAFVVGLVGDQYLLWGVRAGDNKSWHGRYHNLRVAAFACSGVSGERFVPIKHSVNAENFQIWDTRLGEFVTEEEKQRRIRRSSTPSP